MDAQQENDSNVPLAQWAQEEVAEAVQNTNAHLYQEQDQGQESNQALGRTDLLTLIANMQQQMSTMQIQIYEQQDNIIEASHHQQEIDQQVSQLLTALQQNPQVQPQQTTQPLPIAPPLQQPVALPEQQILHAAPRIDAAKPPATFGGMSGGDVESWVMAMGLYFAANETISDNQKAFRMALNLSGTAQNCFHNAIDVPLHSLTSAAMEAELLAAFQILNQDQMACRQLCSLCQITSVDSYAYIFRQTYYTCQDVSPAEAKARFIKGLKQYTRLYVEERSPETLDATILLAQSFDSTRFGPRPGQNPRQGGCTFGRFGSNRQGRGRFNNGQYHGNNHGGRHNNFGSKGRNNGGCNGGRYSNGYPPALTCYCCRQVGHFANRCSNPLTLEMPKN